MEKEEVQEVQEKDNKKSLIWIIIGIACLIVIIIIILILLLFFKSSGKTDISPGPGIESIEVRDNNRLLITRTNLDTQDVSKIKFILKDKNNEQYSYETYQVSNTNYELDASDFGLDDFNDIERAIVIFSYGIVDNDQIIIENHYSCDRDSDCNDRLNCTRDLCFEGVCEYIDDNSCSDGNYCNGLEYCSLENRGCVSGTPVECSSLNDQCNQGMCFEANKSCIKVPKLNGNSCNDNANCTINDICTDGVCIGTTNNTRCEDGITCTLNECRNETCITTPRDNLCNELELCTSTGCVQSACKSCEDCNSFFNNCDFTKCHQNCNRLTSCYYKEGSQSNCINQSYACNNLIKSCSNYSLSECNLDPCNLDCKLENNQCVKDYDCSVTSCSDFSVEDCINNPCNLNCTLLQGSSMQQGISCIEYQAECQPWTKGTGYYKDFWVDGGVGLSKVKPSSADFLGLSSEYMITNSEDEQKNIVVGNSNDLNGVLLYPDNSARFRLVFVNGGYGSHKSSLGNEGVQRFKTYFDNGGSYTGSCQGANLAMSSGFNLWPGKYQFSGSSFSTHSAEFEKDKNHPLVIKLIELANTTTIKGIKHYGGPAFIQSSSSPANTEYIGTIPDGAGRLSSSSYFVAYKAVSNTGRVIIQPSHPEYATSGPQRDLVSSMFYYALDGNPEMPTIKQILQNNVEVAMNSDNTKIGENQYHRYTLQIPSNTHSLTISLTSLSDNVDLYVSKDCPPHQNASQYKSENPSTQSESITINNPGIGEWDISVHGNHNIANGAAYTLKATWQ